MNTIKSINHRLWLVVITALVALALATYPLFADSFYSPLAEQSAPQMAGPMLGGGGGGGNGGCC